MTPSQASSPSASSAPPAPAADTLAQAADALAAALLVLQADGRLLHANQAARALLQDGCLWQLDAEQRVRPTGEAARAAFAAAMAAVLAAGTPLRVPLAEMHGARLSGLPRREDGARTLLLSLPPAPGAVADLPAYAAAHGLSPTETRVLQRLALGEGSARAAAVLGLRATTVRTHVLALRRKTGHSSLPALVQTLGRLPPVAPPPDYRLGPPAAPARAGAAASR